MINKDSKIIDVLRQIPDAVKVFERYEMACAGCMGMVNETIEDGAKIHHLPVEKLVEELNKINGG
jgi:hybrid cluster-associated redox disulfide protein